VFAVHVNAIFRTKPTQANGGFVCNEGAAAREAVYRRIRWGNDCNVKGKGLARKLTWPVSTNSIMFTCRDPRNLQYSRNSKRGTPE
jgi:hypothetical protein